MNSIEMLRPSGLVSSPYFSHTAVVPPGATWVLVGGQNGVDETGRVVSPDIADQTRRALGNVQQALEAGGATLADALSFVVSVVDGVDLRAAYGAISGAMAEAKDAPPVVSVAVVAGLAVPGALVEVAVTAAVLS